MVHYYCTCTTSKDKKKIFLVGRGRSPYRKAKVNKDDICLDCGHYAIAANKELSLGGSNLYNYITGYKDGITNKKRNRNKQWRDGRSKNDEKRANRDGSLGTK